MSHGFLRELKDRHVLRVAGFYLLVSVPIMEAGDIILPRLGLPDWTLTGVLWLLAIGFPIALVIAWFYEITPDGVKSESQLRRTDAPRMQSGRTVDFVVIGLLLMAVAYLAVDKLSGDAPPSIAATGKPSIAVLPFVNMSDDENNEYFSDGVSEELLNSLARIPQLRVAARTSSFYYKGRNEDLRDIGRNLGVATVLEGSVRKDGDRVRVTAQLIDVEDGFHLWSDTYDYTLDDVFAVQNRIARAVVDVLQVQLLGVQAEPVTTPPTTSTHAHTAYLRGRYELHRRTRSSILSATAFFRDATQTDPQYAAAWVGLAESLILQFVNHQSLPRDEAMRGAEEALERALSLDDQLAEAHAALGLLRMQSPDKAGAKEAYERALQIDPNYSEAWHWYGLLNGSTDDRAGAVEKLRKAVELDPLHRVARVNLGQAILGTGDVEGARAFFRQSIELEPDFPMNYMALAGIESTMAWPQPRAALELVNQALRYDTQNFEALAVKAYLAQALDDLATAEATVAQMREANPSNPVTIGKQSGLLLYQGKNEAAQIYVTDVIDRHAQALGNYRNVYVALLAMNTGEFSAASDAWQMAMPALFEQDAVIPKEMAQFVGLVAYSLDRAGRDADAQRVLDTLAQRIEQHDRFGPMGYGLSDVELAVVRGQPEQAVVQLRAALDAGYRNRLMHEAWTLSNYPVFEVLRDDAAFVDMVATIDGYREQDSAAD